MSVYLEAALREMEQAYGSATTDAPSESGYLLADGRWLRMGIDGTRGEDHRIVAGLVRGKLLERAYAGDRWPAVVQWCRVTRSARWMPESRSIEFWTEPTHEQMAELREMLAFLRDEDLDFTVECHGPRGRHHARTYDSWELSEALPELRAFWRDE